MSFWNDMLRKHRAPSTRAFTLRGWRGVSFAIARQWLPIVLCLGIHGLANPRHAAADIVTGLTNYWSLDETSGTIAHDSVSANNATLQNFPNAQPVWVPGKVNNALNFTDSTNYVRTGAPISFNQYTIDFWLKVDGQGGINPRLVGPADGKYAWVILNSEYHRGVGMYNNNGQSLVQDPNSPAIGVWENYAVTIDLVAGQAAVFRNGNQVAAGAFSDNVPQLFWSFGHDQDPANQLNGLNGQLDEIRIYNRVLSASDIRQLVPEPTTWLLASIGAAFVAVVRKRQTRARGSIPSRLSA